MSSVSFCRGRRAMEGVLLHGGTSDLRPPLAGKSPVKRIWLAAVTPFLLRPKVESFHDDLTRFEASGVMESRMTMQPESKYMNWDQAVDRGHHWDNDNAVERSFHLLSKVGTGCVGGRDAAEGRPMIRSTRRSQPRNSLEEELCCTKTRQGPPRIENACTEATGGALAKHFSDTCCLCCSPTTGSAHLPSALAATSSGTALPSAQTFLQCAGDGRHDFITAHHSPPLRPTRPSTGQ